MRSDNKELIAEARMLGMIDRISSEPIVRAMLKLTDALEQVTAERDEAAAGREVERTMLANVPAMIADAKAEAVDDAKQLVMQYLATVEQWRYDLVAEALARRAAAIRAATPVHDKQEEGDLTCQQISPRS